MTSITDYLIHLNFGMSDKAIPEVEYVFDDDPIYWTLRVKYSTDVSLVEYKGICCTFVTLLKFNYVKLKNVTEFQRKLFIENYIRYKSSNSKHYFAVSHTLKNPSFH